MKFFKKRKTITRSGMPLLIRWNLFECRFFSIKIHKLLASDDGCLHDHPWAFITFLLKGGYVEYTSKGSKVYSRFSLLYRPANYTHKLQIHQPVYTLVFTFRKSRVWGFFTPKGWVEWFRYSENSCD